MKLATVFVILIFISSCLTTPKISKDINFNSELVSGESECSSPGFAIADDLFDKNELDTLGLEYPKNIQTAIAFEAKQNTNQYNHGAVLLPFKNKLYLQWQSSGRDEDSINTNVLFSTSENGDSWSDAEVLVKPREGATVSNGGWWTDGDTLVAYINVWPSGLIPKGGFVEYITSKDGINWSSPSRLQKQGGGFVNGIIEQDIKALPNGRLLTAVHLQPGLIATPFYTEDPLGLEGWQAGKLPNVILENNKNRELEPSWFLKCKETVVMVFRDQASSFFVLASDSTDNGEVWSQPVLTNMPDSRAKQSAGNLLNGSAFLVNNPSGSKSRIPLVVSLSLNGALFKQAYLLRGGKSLPPMKYQGRYKREGFSYPKSIVWDGFVWVSYAVNKEDIAVTRVPVESLVVR